MDRRRFLRNATAGLGAASSAGLTAAKIRAESPVDKADRLPREVWVGTLSLDGLEAESYEVMIDKVERRMREMEPYQPDIVCLPEVFPFLKVSKRPPLSEIAEAPLGPISGRIAQYARRNRCYVVCPIYTQESGRYYNSAVVIDRQGNSMGEYRKIHPTESEIEMGVSSGPLAPPVFKTDFGIIGVQICYDINWHEGWRKLRQQGAEMIFWPSAFCGGQMINTMAWINKSYVISSTRFDPTKICDITGEEITSTGRAMHWVCAPVNLEKAFIHGWPHWQKYNDVQNRYGRKVAIRHFWEEGWSVIESRSPDVKVADVLKEFEIKTHEEDIAHAEAVQTKHRA
jgi:beta-ureidopropionase